MRLCMQGIAVALVALIAPIQANADDAAIAKELSEQLRESQSDGTLQGFRLGVNVEDATVWIKGSVASVKQRDLALDKARRIPGVKLVVNDIRVDAPVSSTETTQTTEIVAAEPPATEIRPVRAPPQSRPSAQEPRTDSARHASVDAPASTADRRLPAADARRDQRAAGSPRTSPRSVSRARSNRAARPVPAQRRHRPVNYSECIGGCPPAARRDAIGGAGGYGVGGGSYGGEGGSYGGYGVSGGYEAGGYAGNAGEMGQPVPMQASGYSQYGGGASYEQPQMPAYAWPSYAAHPNYAAVTYPRQYSPMAWPYIGPFYPYPQVPLGWRKVSLEWDDGWWMLDFNSK